MYSLLHDDFLTEALERISPLQLLELDRRVLVEEFVDTHVAATDANQNFVLFDSHIDAFRAELVDAGAVAEEHDLQLVAVRVVVDELRHFHIDRVVAARHVDGHTSLELDDVVFQSVVLELELSDLLEQVQALRVRTKHAVLQVAHVS